MIDQPPIQVREYGAADIHSGPLIRDSLTPTLPRIEYREWERCGHYLHFLPRSTRTTVRVRANMTVRAALPGHHGAGLWSSASQG